MQRILIYACVKFLQLAVKIKEKKRKKDYVLGLRESFVSVPTMFL